MPEARNAGVMAVFLSAGPRGCVLCVVERRPAVLPNVAPRRFKTNQSNCLQVIVVARFLSEIVMCPFASFEKAASQQRSRASRLRHIPCA